MSDLSGLSTNFFATPKEGFTTTLASTISSGAVTVPLNSITGYTNGAIITLVVDPTDPTKKQAFTGVVDTAGVQVTSVKWTEGTNQQHTTGATVVDYVTATHMAALVKGLLIEHGQAGTHSAALITSRTEDTSPDISADYLLAYDTSATSLKKVKPSSLGLTAGWLSPSTLPAPNTVTALGNRSYSCVFNSTDLTSFLSAGMRLRTTRTVVAPTQSTSLNGTTQYYSKSSPAGMTFTDDFAGGAWIKLSSYPTTGTVGCIQGRYNGTSGWLMHINATGQVTMIGFNAGAANFSQVSSYQSVPLNKWVHVAAQLDMSTFTATTTTSYVMIDGVDVPAAVTRGGTNPIQLVQAGNLEIGAYNAGAAGSFFPGKIAQVAIYSAKVTQATILASMHQTLAGTETSLISAYSFNNSINDLNTNANNLTANGSAVATNADSPFGGQADGTISSTLDYAIIQKVAFSTNTTVTVQVPEGCTIPTSGGVSSVVYSSNKAPYGMPVQRGKWKVEQIIATDLVMGGATAGTWYNLGASLTIPVGEWATSYSMPVGGDRTGANYDYQYTLSTANNSETNIEFTGIHYSGATGASLINMMTTAYRERPLSVSAQAPYYFNISTNATGTALHIYGGFGTGTVTGILSAENAYL